LEWLLLELRLQLWTQSRFVSGSVSELFAHQDLVHGLIEQLVIVLVLVLENDAVVGDHGHTLLGAQEAHLATEAAAVGGSLPLAQNWLIKMTRRLCCELLRNSIEAGELLLLFAKEILLAHGAIELIACI